MHQDYEKLRSQIDGAIEKYTSDIKKVVLDESKLYSLNIELNKLIYLKGAKDDLEFEKPPFDEKLSFIEKAFAIHDVTNEFQNVSRGFLEKSPLRHPTTNMSLYNFSESKIKEFGKGSQGT